MTSPNLIPGSRRHKADRRRRARTWIRFLRPYSLVLAVLAGLAILPAHAQGPSFNATIARLDRRIELAKSNAADLRHQQAGLDRALNISSAIANHPDWSLVLKAVARVRGADATLDAFELSTIRVAESPKPGDKAPKVAPHDVHTIKISGFSPDTTAVYRFAERLTRLGFADTVTVKDNHPQPLGANTATPATHFDIEITISGAQPAPAETGAAKEGEAK
jgi:hypothetical protein